MSGREGLLKPEYSDWYPTLVADPVAQPQQVEAPLEPSRHQAVDDRAALHALELGPLDFHQLVKQLVRRRVQPSVVRLLCLTLTAIKRRCSRSREGAYAVDRPMFACLYWGFARHAPRRGRHPPITSPANGETLE